MPEPTNQPSLQEMRIHASLALGTWFHGLRARGSKKTKGHRPTDPRLEVLAQRSNSSLPTYHGACMAIIAITAATATTATDRWARHRHHRHQGHHDHHHRHHGHHGRHHRPETVSPSQLPQHRTRTTTPRWNSWMELCGLPACCSSETYVCIPWSSSSLSTAIVTAYHGRHRRCQLPSSPRL